jgi:hypothetical protein
MQLCNHCKRPLKRAVRGFTQVAAVFCLAASAAANAQVDLDEKDTLVAEFAVTIDSAHARRVTDVKMAKDELREVRLRLGVKLAEERARVHAIGRRLQALVARDSTTQAELIATGAELEKARRSRADVARAYTEVAAQNADMSAAIETYKSQLALFLGQASRAEQEAIRQFVEGDDSAYAKIKVIIRAENAARKASAARAGAIRLGQAAYIFQSSKMLDRVSRDEMVAEWNEAIAADPTYGAYRLALCRYALDAVALAPGQSRWGPRQEPLRVISDDARWASGICQKMVKEAPSSDDKLLLLRVQADTYLFLDQTSEVLRVSADANRIIDNAIAKRKGTLGMLDPLIHITEANRRAQKELSWQKRKSEIGKSSHEERHIARARYTEDTKLAEGAIYQVVARQMDVILAQQGSAQHDPRAWAAMATLARRVADDDGAFAAMLIKRVWQSAMAGLVFDPNNKQAHLALIESLDRLRSLGSSEESESLGLVQIDHWRTLLKLDPDQRDYREGLAETLASVANDMKKPIDRARRIAFGKESLALSTDLAKSVDPRGQLVATQTLAEAYRSLATSQGIAGQWALAIENAARGLEVGRFAFEIAEKDPMEIAIRAGPYPPEAPVEALRELTEYLLEAGERDQAISVADDWLNFLTAHTPREGNSAPQSDDIDEVKELLDDLSVTVRVVPKS